MTDVPHCTWCGELWPGELRRCLRCGNVPERSELENGIGQGIFGLMLLGLAAGVGTTGFEGKWLQEFDPTRKGTDLRGRPMIAHIAATDDATLAMRFAEPGAARRVWMRWDGTRRPDGRPSRPLTAFTIEVARIWLT